jgi:predicted DNA-binding protein (MmcQ/YjbR family)
MASARRKKATAKTPAAKPAKKPFVSKHPPKPRTRAMLALIERLRAICLALPDTTEQEAWAEPTWRIGGRIFAQCDSRRDGEPRISVHLPAPLGAQEGLIESDPERFYRPPYVGSRGWIAIVLDTNPDWSMVASLIKTAYDLIATKPKRHR